MFRESLLQSSLWQAFQEKNERVCVMGKFGLGIIETLPVVGTSLYLPRGPIGEIAGYKEDLLEAAKRAGAGWIRVEPGSEGELEELKAVFQEFQTISAPHDIQPREILVMDIAPTEEILLSLMKQKTRYNIRLAEKHGVTVRFSRSIEDMETFIELIYTTTNRKAIRPYPKSYYRNFLATFPEENCVVALALHEGKVLAANLLVFFEETAYYLHGGSSDEGRHLMAPFFLQWKSIGEAKRRGMIQYNFGGVRTGTETNNSWAGITRFKQGFAPKTLPIAFPGAYDIILSPWRYRLYRTLRLAQKIKNIFR